MNTDVDITRQKDFAMCTPQIVVTAVLLSGACADHALPDKPCIDAELSGPALTTDPVIYEAGHAGARVIDYGVRELASEFRSVPGVECGVLRDTAPVAQWIARPPPKGQVAGSIPARGTNSLDIEQRRD